MSSRPGLPRLTALALASMMRWGSRLKLPPDWRAASRGRGCARRRGGDVGEGVGALGPLARHRLSPPLIVVSSSICASGSSATKRLGMRAGPLAVDAAVGGVEDGRACAGRG